jgi:hypothetical protein
MLKKQIKAKALRKFKHPSRRKKLQHLRYVMPHLSLTRRDTASIQIDSRLHGNDSG